MELRGFKFGRLAKGVLVPATIALLLAAIAPASAATLGNSAGNGNGTSGQPTGNYLFTYFIPGVNRFELINPNGCGNGGVSNTDCTSETDECAMIYLFDSIQEMLGCCGCRISPNKLLTGTASSTLSGLFVIAGSAINNPGSTPYNCADPSNPSCNDGCDPTVPAITSGDTNLVGSITHVQTIGSTTGLVEIPLFDQGAGNPVDNAYLASECGSLIGDGFPPLCTCSFEK
jgi:hypothetical protein